MYIINSPNRKKSPLAHYRFRLSRLCIAVAGWMASGATAALAVSPMLEFETPYAISVLPGGDTIEITGSFSRAVPQNFSAVLASAPGIKTVRLNSPGGLLQAGEAVAGIIRARDLDTVVTLSCASACTVAFLGGHNRTLAPGAKLGFHAAYAPNTPKRWLDAVMRQSYGRFGVPAPFIDRVIATRAEDLWTPAEKELLEAGIISGPPSPALPREPLPATFGDQINTTSSAALTGYAEAFRGIVASLESVSPSICNGFLRGAAMPYEQYIPAADMSRWRVASRQVRAETGQVVSVEQARKDQIRTSMFESLHDDPEAENAYRHPMAVPGLCRAYRRLLDRALTLPEQERDPILRTILGNRS